MRIQSIFHRPAALIGILGLGTAIGVSCLGIVRADLVQPAKIQPAKDCHKSTPCLVISNTGTGALITSSGSAGADIVSSSSYQTALLAEETGSASIGAEAIGTEYGATIDGGTYGAYMSGSSYGAFASGGAVGLYAEAPPNGSGDPLILADNYGNVEDFTDTVGNIWYHGSLVQFAKTRGGELVAAYGCQSTTHTLDDVGSARLTNGAAFVHLHRTFAQAIELQADPYRVFLTPNGENRGLYIAQKMTNGFIVRESERGRSNIDFDYRVVAPALGHAGERMGVTPLPQTPHVPKPPRTPRLPELQQPH
jgi:hypothetical protein